MGSIDKWTIKAKVFQWASPIGHSTKRGGEGFLRSNGCKEPNCNPPKIIFLLFSKLLVLRRSLRKSQKKTSLLFWQDNFQTTSKLGELASDQSDEHRPLRRRKQWSSRCKSKDLNLELSVSCQDSQWGPKSDGRLPLKANKRGYEEPKLGKLV